LGFLSTFLEKVEPKSQRQEPAAPIPDWRCRAYALG